MPLTLWIAAAAAGIAASAALYLGRTARGGAVPRGWRLLPALLRAAAGTLLAALILNAPVGREPRGRSIAVLDVSLSWLRASTPAAWQAARAAARSAGGELWLAGDSVRTARAPELPADQNTGLRAAVERAAAAGRPVIVFTDGEVTDPDAITALPLGSRVRVVPPARRPDLGLVRVDAPTTLAAGDTLAARIAMAADGAGAPARRLSARLGNGRPVTVPVVPLPPYGEAALELRVSTAGLTAGGTLLSVALAGAPDGEARNDTLVVPVEITATPGAVFASTAPDFDARYALAVLRGSLALPATGYFRIAPGVWRDDRTFAAVPERVVRAAVRAAPLVALHGDTAYFGLPARATTGNVVLVPRFDDRGEEWYASVAPPSPVASALSGTPWDSLPPIGAVAPPPRGDWTALGARLGRAGTPRAIVVGREGERRVVVVGASGLWRWQFRGGVSADAFAALWGGIFDWLAAGRSDQRAALPDGAVRTGEAVRWRRGAGSSADVSLTLVPRGAPSRTTRVPLRFAPGAIIAESPPLPVGVYDVQAPGGASVVVVNPSAEWVPRRPTIRNRDAAEGPPVAADLRGIRSHAWPYVLLIVLLAAEWLVRRRLLLT